MEDFSRYNILILITLVSYLST